VRFCALQALNIGSEVFTRGQSDWDIDICFSRSVTGGKAAFSAWARGFPIHHVRHGPTEGYIYQSYPGICAASKQEGDENVSLPLPPKKGALMREVWEHKSREIQLW